MAQRGRKSGAELAVVGETTVQERQSPPEKLTPRERDVWLRLVNAMAASWFEPENQNLLVSYVRDVVEADRVSMLIDQLFEDEEGFDDQAYKRLVDVRDKLHSAIRSAETKLAITPQIRSDRRRQPGKPKKTPWEG